MYKEYVIEVDEETGEVGTIYSDDLKELFNNFSNVQVARLSHVEPTKDGKWQADMSPIGGKSLPETDTREESLALEVENINSQPSLIEAIKTAIQQ